MNTGLTQKQERHLSDVDYLKQAVKQSNNYAKAYNKLFFEYREFVEKARFKVDGTLFTKDQNTFNTMREHYKNRYGVQLIQARPTTIEMKQCRHFETMVEYVSDILYINSTFHKRKTTTVKKLQQAEVKALKLYARKEALEKQLAELRRGEFYNFPNLKSLTERGY